MHKQLKKNIKKSSKTAINTHNDYLSGVESDLKKSHPDTFIYINVFEHIEDDAAEIRKIKSLLKKGGHVIIFVPALTSLYSDYDKSIGHFRRYTKDSLEALCKNAGLEIISLGYRDIFGTASWWFNFVALKRGGLSPSMVKVYDKFFVPVIRAAESRVKVPFGKNVMVVAKKS